ncbi:hypothetical protein ACTFIW_000041 [Dictyostelium discoideum]
MSTTVNNNYASSSTSASNNAESFDLIMKSMEDQIINISLAFTRFMKESMLNNQEEQEVNLPVCGRLFHHKQVWKKLGLPNFCQEVVNGLKIHLLPNFKPMTNPIPIPISIPKGPKSDCITKEVQDLLLDEAIEQIVPNSYSKRVFYSNVFTVPKPGTTLHPPLIFTMLLRPVL